MAIHQALKIGAVDLVVIGSTTGAVSAALAAHEKGARVFVVGDRAYFGEESAGAFELNELPLGGASAPGPVKHALEKRLLEKGIPFLFMARPVAVLEQGGGGVAGVVVAHRTALYAIEAGGIVDLTRAGVVTKCPGAPVAKTHRDREPMVQGVSTMLIGMDEMSISGAKSVGERFVMEGMKTGQTLQAYRHWLPVADASSGLNGPEAVAANAAREGVWREEFLHQNLVYTADVQLPVYEIEEGVGDVALLTDTDFLAGERIWVAGNTLPLNTSGLRFLDDAMVQWQVGERVGALAADGVVGRNRVPAEVAKGGGASRYRFSPPFYRGTDEVIEFSLPAQPVLAECDVVVAGGGTGGAPAGIAAAREGARTIVLEYQRGLGGVGTLGQIASYYYGLLIGFTDEINAGMREIDPTYGNSDRDVRWNVEVKMALLLQKLRAAGGEAWLGSFAFGLEMDGEDVTGVLVSTPYGSGVIKTKAVVDASGSADLAAAAGAPCRVTDGTHVAVQGTGLSERRPGFHYLNSDFDFIDDNDPLGVTHGFVNARAKFKERFDTIPFVNSRERRQIIGDVELTPLDLLAQRRFPDTIAMAMSNFDSHGFTVHPMFMAVPPDREKITCAVPFRAFLPKNVKNMAVTGLGMSAHRDALPVVRMQADVQNHGYSLGLAAAMAARNGGGMREVPLRELQELLLRKGILRPGDAFQEDSFPVAHEAVLRAAWQTPLDHGSAAVLFAHPGAAAPELKRVLAETCSESQREEAALVLGLLGERAAAPVLMEVIRNRGWDEGWDYRGMGQFGMSVSRMDALVIALGVLHVPEGLPVLLEKIEALGEIESCAFSHCRAVAIAAGFYPPSEGLQEGLQRLLNKPGVQGHDIGSTQRAIELANDNKIETAPRNGALREITLAKGLYLQGDPQGLGRAILERYALDLRGLFARHAKAILAAKTEAAKGAIRTAY